MSRYELDIRKLYKFDVYRAHRTKMARKYFDLYAWFWYRVEFWKEPADRRPFTLLIRDYFHACPALGIPITLLVAAGLGYATYVSHWVAVADMFFGFAMGHLFWAKWIPGEQEEPPYIEE